MGKLREAPATRAGGIDANCRSAARRRRVGSGPGRGAVASGLLRESLYPEAHR